MSPMVGLRIVGLDAYTPAPQPAEPPEWLATSGELWARVDGACVPLQHVAAGFELATCVEDSVTCGVTGTTTGLLTMSSSWCRRDQEQVIEPWDGRTYVLVAADADTATYRAVAHLSLEPTGIEFVSQRCTSSSLRAWRAHERDVERAAKSGELAPTWAGAHPVFGNRMCIRFDGLAVREGELDFSWLDGSYDFHIPSQPERWTAAWPAHRISWTR